MKESVFVSLLVFVVALSALAALYKSPLLVDASLVFQSIGWESIDAK